MKKLQFKKMLIIAAGAFTFLTTSCGGGSAPDVKVTSIEFRTELSDVYVGHETYITGVRVLPENANNKEIAWSSLDSSIATISEDGIVSGLKAGSTKLVATALDGSNVTKEIDFKVKPLEKPSSWSLKDSYCFYVDDLFTPDLDIYPHSDYVDRTATFEIIEGEDVLKLEDGKIGAKKEGSGIVKATANGNKELTGNITCIAEKDLFARYGYKETSVDSEAEVVSEKLERNSVLDFKGTVKQGNWAFVIIQLEKMYEAKNFVVSLDARSVTGAQWFSIRLAKDGSIFQQTEYGAEAIGGKPQVDKWLPYTFDYTMHDLDFNQIVLCINADSDYQEGKTDPVTEMLFDNLKFAEFVDNPTAITIKQPQVLLPLGQTSNIEVEFTPKYVRNRGLTYTVKPGSEEIVKVEDGQLVGLKAGTGYVTVASSVNPEAKAEATVIVTDALLVTLPIVFNDGVNYEHVVDGDKGIATAYTLPSTPGENWLGICYQLPTTYKCNEVTIKVDCKLVSGYDWFSITYRNGDFNKDEIGKNPTNEWENYDFNSTKTDEFNRIIIRINPKTSGGSTLTEVLFANLEINPKN